MTDWTPGIVVAAASAAIGTLLALRSRRGPALPDEAATRRADLLRQKEAALALLREHDGAKAAWEADAWEAERRRLEHAAAGVLRELDAAPATAPSPTVASRHPQLVGAAWGAGAVLLVGAIAMGLQEYSRPREVMEGQGERVDAELDALRAAVAANPADLEAKNRLGHALINASQMMDAYKLSEEVVALDDDNAEARTHQAVVLLAIGDLEVAAKVLDRVLAGDPAFPEALGWRGAVHYQKGEMEPAVALWEKAIAADPALAASLQPLIQGAKQKPLVGTFSTELAPAGPGDMPKAATPQDVSGEIRGDASLVKPGDTLMLFARPEGVDRGPPVWAQRRTIDTLPVRFTIGPADAPMGGATPEKLVLTARIDRDGNPMGRAEGEAEGKSAAFAPGATGVVVELAP
ncbi:MAG: tetratricopeptide repeat protein [Myxococcota bacterium]